MIDGVDTLAAWMAVFIAVAALGAGRGGRVYLLFVTLPLLVAVLTYAGLSSYAVTSPPLRVPVAAALLVAAWLHAGLHQSVITKFGSALSFWASAALTLALALYGPLAGIAGASWVAGNSDLNLLPVSQPGRGLMMTVIFTLYLAPPFIAGLFADATRR